jgi:hypothetical protein
MLASVPQRRKMGWFADGRHPPPSSRPRAGIHLPANAGPEAPDPARAAWWTPEQGRGDEYGMSTWGSLAEGQLPVRPRLARTAEGGWLAAVPVLRPQSPQATRKAMRLSHAKTAKFTPRVQIATPRRSMKPATVSMKIADIVERHRHVLRGVRFTFAVCAVSQGDRAIAILEPPQIARRSGLRVSICQV